MKSRENFQKIFEKLRRKFWINFSVTVNHLFFWGYDEILKTLLWNSSEIVKKLWRNVGNTSYICKHSDGSLVIFSCSFLEKLVKNCRKNMKLFWENFGKMWENYEIINFDGNFVIFSLQFLEKFCENLSEKYEIILRKFLKNCWKL